MPVHTVYWFIFLNAPKVVERKRERERAGERERERAGEREKEKENIHNSSQQN